MDLGPHADFIVAAYAAAVIIVIVMIGWVLVDYRTQRRLLADLDKSGVTRRSERTVRDSAPARSA